MNNQRRDFIKKSASAVTTLGFMPQMLADGFSKIPLAGRHNDQIMVAMQIAPFNPLDEGIEACLDRVLHANINHLFMYSHTYYGIPYTRTANVLADDHGIVQRNDVERVFDPVWVRHDLSNFKDTSLRFKKPKKQVEHEDRDVFEEIQKPAAERGIKVCARILEPGTSEALGRIENWEKVASVNVYGEMGIEPCRNHPEYRAWWVGMVTDLFNNYRLDGYQWGAERSGPLAEVMERGSLTGCFCSHCLQRGKSLGIDPERAKKGFLAIYSVHEAIRKGINLPKEGVMPNLMSLQIRYPEMLVWENMWRQSKEELYQIIYKTIKSIKPDAIVGRHIESKCTTLWPWTRANIDYRKMASYTDFIKPILYHDVMGARMKQQLTTRSNGPMYGMREEDIYEWIKAFNGYEGNTAPDFEELESKSFGAEYVAYETGRLVNIVEGKTSICPGIGLDVPHREEKNFLRTPQDEEVLQEVVVKSFESGATSIMACREYDEMRIPTLKAFGEGIRKMKLKKPDGGLS